MRSLTPNSSQHWHLQLFKIVFGALQIVDAAVELDYIVRQRVQRVGYGQRREADAVRIRGVPRSNIRASGDLVKC